jgi:hypothetical protein
VESRWTDLSISHYLLLDNATTKLNRKGPVSVLGVVTENSLTALKVLALLEVKMSSS